MKRLISFFDIPASNFERAIEFYEAVFELKLDVHDCKRKMAVFPAEDGIVPGAVTCMENFKPSADGVLLNFTCKDIDKALETIEKNGGKILVPKTKTISDQLGWWALFIDSEGNRIGLYSSLN